MKRLSLFLLALLMLLSLPACAGSAPEPTAAPTPEPAPSGGVELWYYRAQSRYNMEYGGFGEYLSLMCDDFYGDSQYDEGDIDQEGFQDLSFEDGSMF